MKYSIVIPAFNAAHTIMAAIESCWQQTVQDIEIIVIDDASTDNTLALLEKYDSRITTIRHEHNKGVSAARNSGWEAATGDYVAFLDSDDVWHPEKLFWIDNYLKQHPTCNCIAHQYTSDATILQQQPVHSATKNLSFSSLLLRNKVQGSCIVVRRNIALRFDEHLRYCEDHDFALRNAYLQPMAFLETALTLLSRPQQSEGGLSANRWAMRKGELYLYSKIGRLNPLLFLLIPLLWAYSLSKHLWQKLS